MTHEGQSAARVTGGCFVMGQAAAPPRILRSPAIRRSLRFRLKRCKRLLEKDGAYLGRDVN